MKKRETDFQKKRMTGDFDYPIGFWGVVDI